MIPVPAGSQGGGAGGQGGQREGHSLTSNVHLAWQALPGGCSWDGWYRHTPTAGITVLVNLPLNLTHNTLTYRTSHTLTHHTNISHITQ